MKNIASALLKSQIEIKHATKDAKNPHFKNDYATLESVIDAVKDTANKNGIVIMQNYDGNSLITNLIHAESGEVLQSKLELIIDKNNMQGLGSATTYARRYSLASMFCISQIDDDANTSSQQTSYQKPQPQKSFSQPSRGGFDDFNP